MASEARSRAILPALAIAALVKAACGEPPSSSSPIAEAITAALADVGPSAVAPALARAASAAEGLRSAVAAWESAPADPAAHAAAQAAWRAALDAWQEVDVMQVGPAGPSLTAIAGDDLRDRVYSWPTVNRCRVDQETVYAAWDEADFLDTSLVNVLGFDALEVLLFAPAGETTCPPQIDVVADGRWAALGVDGVQANRAAYARALADDLDATVDALVDAWSPDGGDFGAALASAGEAGSPYATPEEALNAVFDAAFYIELVTKDRKLGFVLGRGACVSGACSDDRESPLAGGSSRWVAANLRGFRSLFFGGDGAGLDDLLVAAGRADLVDALRAALDAADAAAAALPDDLIEDPSGAQATFDALADVTTLLKGEIATTLALQIPSEAAGDAD